MKHKLDKSGKTRILHPSIETYCGSPVRHNTLLLPASITQPKCIRKPSSLLSAKETTNTKLSGKATRYD